MRARAQEQVREGQKRGEEGRANIDTDADVFINIAISTDGEKWRPLDGRTDRRTDGQTQTDEGGVKRASFILLLTRPPQPQPQPQPRNPTRNLADAAAASVYGWLVERRPLVPYDAPKPANLSKDPRAARASPRDRPGL